ncbi:MAG: alpha/beta hydrolase [Bacilli bacterium]|nr:alpha/beta hydrolase [Bacilli bacterium]MDD4283095.1 alpha/beta hydrolase [Bacilli bacterium]MDD4719161.1 alpha/beta hydrolase [Bacilli bacterium]
MEIKGININYTIYGNELGEPIVFLHGWGQNIEMMKPLADLLSQDYKIIIIDLPGHGKSDEPLYPWTVPDYQDAIKELVENLNIFKPSLVGHSFGGKISLLYASNYEVNKLVVLGSPFKANDSKISRKMKILKGLKKVPGLKNFEEFAKKRIGSTDYKNASPIMRQVLVNTVNFDISKDVKKIKCPTLIIWGDLDEAVPLEHAYDLEKLIPDAGVVVLNGATHYAYLERVSNVANMIRSLLGGNKK